MQKIFDEIKKAIEEEMRNAEGQPPPSGQREGGRRAQEYSEWLKQEQERLRDGRQPETLQEVPVGSVPPPEQQAPSHEEQEWAGPRDRRDHSDEARQPQQGSGSQRTGSDYWQGSGGGRQLQRQVHQLLRSPSGMRQAFLLREIVDKPVSMRDRDDHLIS